MTQYAQLRDATYAQGIPLCHANLQTLLKKHHASEAVLRVDSAEGPTLVKVHEEWADRVDALNDKSRKDYGEWSDVGVLYNLDLNRLGGLGKSQIIRFAPPGNESYTRGENYERTRVVGLKKKGFLSRWRPNYLPLDKRIQSPTTES